MKKILFCATIDYHFMSFHLPYLKFFRDEGWEVHVAAGGNLELPYVDKRYTMLIPRSPFHLANFSAHKALKEIIDREAFDLLHCHTPMGGVLARLAARDARGRGTKVLYTAHGFHFCKGAPLVNWLLYYPAERWLSHHTDCLITINDEDYGRAVKDGFKAGRIERIHGVGVDTDSFHPADPGRRLSMRMKHGYRPDEFLMLYGAEFTRNKNQALLIRALAHILDKAPQMRLLLAGEGILLEECRSLAKSLRVSDRVDFLGFRTDMGELLAMCDLVAASSLREGLPVNILEAMACGLPIVASDNRGHRELVADGENGFLVSAQDTAAFARRLLELYGSRELRAGMGQNGRQRVKAYSLERAGGEMKRIYRSLCQEDCTCSHVLV